MYKKCIKIRLGICEFHKYARCVEDVATTDKEFRVKNLKAEAIMYASAFAVLLLSLISQPHQTDFFEIIRIYN